MNRRLSKDAGTTAVEFALVVLVLLTIALGAVDFGLWMFQKSEAEQAAREAARVAMINAPLALGAQTSGTVYTAARAELESSLPNFALSVSCQSATSPPVVRAGGTTDPCQPGDQLTVTVSWHRDPLTFIGFTDTVSGSSTRTVVGVP
jgi:Flp pilus assembly protein TadG